MKKLFHTFTKVVSLLLVMSMLCGTASAIQISETDKVSDDISTIYLSDNIRIDGYTDKNGNAILCEYTDGVLTQRNTVFNGNSTYYQRETFGDNPVCELVYVDEYISSEIRQVPANIQAKSKNMSGSIQYRAQTAYGYVYYKLNCICIDCGTIQTTHTIKSFTGKILDLASLLLSVFSITANPTSFKSYLRALCIKIGVNFVEDEIKTPFTHTFSCDKTTYEWIIADSNIPLDPNLNPNSAPDEAKLWQGHKYYVDDEDSTIPEGSIIYDGYTPKDWRTSNLATWYHNLVYGYTQWEVIGWSALG